MLKKVYLLPIVFLIFSFTQINAQENCESKKTLKVSELQGQLLFEHQLNSFSLKTAGVGISRSKNSSPFREIQPDNNGRFEFKDLKPGKYYLSVESFVGDIANLEFEIITKSVPKIIDDQIELTLRGRDQPCKIRIVKTFNNANLAGITDIPGWENISEITLERTGCYGTCPIEKITLRKDGSAIYIGAANVPKIGMFRGTFEYGFGRLAELIYRQGFFNLKDRYENPFKDMSSTNFTVVRNGKSKTVENYGGAAPVELWGMELAFDSIAKKIEWTSYLPLSELKKVDLSRIALISSRGRVQDTKYNSIRTIEKLTIIGKDSIPFLIDKLDDETKIKHHVMNHWSEVYVGDLALVILTDFFTDANLKNTTIPGVGWDEFLERGADKDSTGKEILRNYIAKYGRKKIKERWENIWDENKENIYWDIDERCFKVKPIG